MIIRRKINWCNEFCLEVKPKRCPKLNEESYCLTLGMTDGGIINYKLSENNNFFEQFQKKLWEVRR